jgi:hypothetical protein
VWLIHFLIFPLICGFIAFGANSYVRHVVSVLEQHKTAADLVDRARSQIQSNLIVARTRFEAHYDQLCMILLPINVGFCLTVVSVAKLRQYRESTLQSFEEEAATKQKPLDVCILHCSQ